MLADEAEDCRETLQAGVDLAYCQHRSVTVHDRHVMVVFSPVDPYAQAHDVVSTPLRSLDVARATSTKQRDQHGDLMEALNGAASHKPLPSPGIRQGHRLR